MRELREDLGMEGIVPHIFVAVPKGAVFGL